MRIQQVVDWPSPNGQPLAARVDRQKQRRLLIALALLSVVGVAWALYFHNLLFLLAAVLGLLVWWNAPRSLGRVLTTARNSGVTNSGWRRQRHHDGSRRPGAHGAGTLKFALFPKENPDDRIPARLCPRSPAPAR